jgi:hypothetical protein
MQPGMIGAADDNAVEGPHECWSYFPAFPGVLSKTGVRMPGYVYPGATLHGVLRLQNRFAFAKQFLRSG